MYGYDPVDPGGNMRVIQTREEAVEASHEARQNYEKMYLQTVHIDLDGRIGAKWWPLTAYPRDAH